MLKPEQISNAQFTLIGKGAYRADEVDAFLKTAADSFRENMEKTEELMRKISILADRIEQYREEEDSIKSALINAERMAKTIRREAEEEKENILNTAKAEASELIENARQNAKDFVAKTKATIAAYTEKTKEDTEAAIHAAKQTAEETVASANEKAVAIIGDSEERLAFNQEQAQILRGQIAAYKLAIKELCNKQLKFVDSLPEEEDAPVVEAEILPTEEEEFAVREPESEEEPVAPATAEEPVFVSETEEEAAPAEAVAEETEEEIFTEFSDLDAFEDVSSASVEEPIEEEKEEDIFVDLFQLEEKEENDTADAIADDFLLDTSDGAEEEFGGFKINLDDISVNDEGDDDVSSVFSGFFD